MTGIFDENERNLREMIESKYDDIGKNEMKKNGDESLEESFD